MKIFHSIDEVNIKSPVLTTGMFDGVHKGHLELINQVKKRASEMGTSSMVVTFNPHPRLVLTPDANLELLTTLNERIVRFEKSGIDALLVIPFTKEFSKLSSFDFMSEILMGELSMLGFVLGYDHRFGSGRTEGYDAYKRFCDEHRIFIEKIEAKSLGDELVSSSAVRAYLKKGEVKEANPLLGYPYPLTGVVVKGVQIGRTIGFPTANLKLEDSHKLIPALGVYAVWVNYKGKKLPGMMNIGYRPTIKNSDGKPTIEIHLINFEGDLYDEFLHVEMVEKLREEISFPGLEDLKTQLTKDKKNTLDCLM